MSKEELRKEFKKEFSDTGMSVFDIGETADWWLGKLDAYKSELVERIEGMKTPALVRNEEVECCNCGEDLSLESYDWFDKGYEESGADILNLIKEGKE